MAYNTLSDIPQEWIESFMAECNLSDEDFDKIPQSVILRYANLWQQFNKFDCGPLQMEKDDSDTDYEMCNGDLAWVTVGMYSLMISKRSQTDVNISAYYLGKEYESPLCVLSL